MGAGIPVESVRRWKSREGRWSAQRHTAARERPYQGETRSHLFRLCFPSIVPCDVSKSPSSHNQEIPKLCFIGRKSVFVTFWESLVRTVPHKEIRPVNPKGNQFWIFIGRTDTESEAPIVWSPDSKSWLTGKDHDAGKDWRQKEKRVAENEMLRQHHWSLDMNLSKFQEIMKDRGVWCAAVHA